VAYPKYDWVPLRRRIDDFGEDGEKSGRIFGDVKSSLQQQAGPILANAGIKDVEGFGLSKRIQQERNTVGSFGWWRTEPDVGRVANGVPFRVDRLKGLGNAVVPQIPEIIGRAILASAYHSEAPRSE
jgi:DNA (cytosine-5)-methyltransferase 1